MNAIRAARALLVLLVVVLAAVYLPQLYWLAFDVNVRAPRVVYSPVLDSLLFVRSGAREAVYTDRAGKEYTRARSRSRPRSVVSAPWRSAASERCRKVVCSASERLRQ